MKMPKIINDKLKELGATIEVFTHSSGFDYFIDAPEGYEFNATLSSSICGSYYRNQELYEECFDRIIADINKGIYIALN